MTFSDDPVRTVSGPRRAFLDELAAGLERRREEGLLRRLEPAAGIDFASNDYLGMAHHETLRERLLELLRSLPLGAPASRLLRGNAAAHEAAEDAFARFKGAEGALLFPSGYQANLALTTALVRPEDRVLSDELNHASLIDGLRLTRSRRVIYPHLDLDFLERELARPHPGGRSFVVTESLFSMDGDMAPLDRLADIAERHGALLLVDEAHATGLFGDARGSGLLEAFAVEPRVLAATSTCGKALGLAGAFVTGPAVVIRHLLNHARSFVYTTAPLPLAAAAVPIVLEILAREPWRRAAARRNAATLCEQLRARGVERATVAGPIVPVWIGDQREALDVARRVRADGFDARALRPPTVPPGTSRLRMSVHADHTTEALGGVAASIARALAGVAVPPPEHSRKRSP